MTAAASAARSQPGVSSGASVKATDVTNNWWDWLTQEKSLLPSAAIQAPSSSSGLLYTGASLFSADVSTATCTVTPGTADNLGHGGIGGWDSREAADQSRQHQLRGGGAGGGLRLLPPTTYKALVVLMCQARSGQTQAAPGLPGVVLYKDHAPDQSAGDDTTACCPANPLPLSRTTFSSVLLGLARRHCGAAATAAAAAATAAEVQKSDHDEQEVVGMLDDLLQRARAAPNAWHKLLQTCSSSSSCEMGGTSHQLDAASTAFADAVRLSRPPSSERDGQQDERSSAASAVAESEEPDAPRAASHSGGASTSGAVSGSLVPGHMVSGSLADGTCADSADSSPRDMTGRMTTCPSWRSRLSVQVASKSASVHASASVPPMTAMTVPTDLASAEPLSRSLSATSPPTTTPCSPPDASLLLSADTLASMHATTGDLQQQLQQLVPAQPSVPPVPAQPSVPPVPPTPSPESVVWSSLRTDSLQDGPSNGAHAHQQAAHVGTPKAASVLTKATAAVAAAVAAVQQATAVATAGDDLPPAAAAAAAAAAHAQPAAPFSALRAIHGKPNVRSLQQHQGLRQQHQSARQDQLMQQQRQLREQLLLQEQLRQQEEALVQREIRVVKQQSLKLKLQHPGPHSPLSRQHHEYSGPSQLHSHRKTSTSTTSSAAAGAAAAASSTSGGVQGSSSQPSGQGSSAGGTMGVVAFPGSSTLAVRPHADSGSESGGSEPGGHVGGTRRYSRTAVQTGGSSSLMPQSMEDGLSAPIVAMTAGGQILPTGTGEVRASVTYTLQGTSPLQVSSGTGSSRQPTRPQHTKAPPPRATLLSIKSKIDWRVAQQQQPSATSAPHTAASSSSKASTTASVPPSAAVQQDGGTSFVPHSATSADGRTEDVCASIAEALSGDERSDSEDEEEDDGDGDDASEHRHCNVRGERSAVQSHLRAAAAAAAAAATAAAVDSGRVVAGRLATPLQDSSSSDDERDYEGDRVVAARSAPLPRAEHPVVERSVSSHRAAALAAVAPSSSASSSSSSGVGAVRRTAAVAAAAPGAPPPPQPASTPRPPSHSSTHMYSGATAPSDVWAETAAESWAALWGEHDSRAALVRPPVPPLVPPLVLPAPPNAAAPSLTTSAAAAIAPSAAAVAVLSGGLALSPVAASSSLLPPAPGLTSPTRLAPLVGHRRGPVTSEPGNGDDSVGGTPYRGSSAESPFRSQIGPFAEDGVGGTGCVTAMYGRTSPLKQATLLRYSSSGDGSLRPGTQDHGCTVPLDGRDAGVLLAERDAGRTLLATDGGSGGGGGWVGYMRSDGSHSFGRATGMAAAANSAAAAHEYQPAAAAAEVGVSSSGNNAVVAAVAGSSQAAFGSSQALPNLRSKAAPAAKAAAGTSNLFPHAHTRIALTTSMVLGGASGTPAATAGPAGSPPSALFDLALSHHHHHHQHLSHQRPVAAMRGSLGSLEGNGQYILAGQAGLAGLSPPSRSKGDRHTWAAPVVERDSGISGGGGNGSGGGLSLRELATYSPSFSAVLQSSSNPRAHSPDASRQQPPRSPSSGDRPASRMLLISSAGGGERDSGGGGSSSSAGGAVEGAFDLPPHAAPRLLSRGRGGGTEGGGSHQSIRNDGRDSRPGPWLLSEGSGGDAAAFAGAAPAASNRVHLPIIQSRVAAAAAAQGKGW